MNDMAKTLAEDLDRTLNMDGQRQAAEAARQGAQRQASALGMQPQTLQGYGPKHTVSRAQIQAVIDDLNKTVGILTEALNRL